MLSMLFMLRSPGLGVPSQSSLGRPVKTAVYWRYRLWCLRTLRLNMIGGA